MRHTDNYETPVCTAMACLSPSPAPAFLRSCQLSYVFNPFLQLLNFRFDSSPGVAEHLRRLTPRDSNWNLAGAAASSFAVSWEFKVWVQLPHASF